MGSRIKLARSSLDEYTKLRESCALPENQDQAIDFDPVKELNFEKTDNEHLLSGYCQSTAIKAKTSLEIARLDKV